MNELGDVAPEHLLRAEAEHLCRGRIHDGDQAVEVDAVDAVTDGFKDRIGLAAEGAKLIFGADLLGDVDGKAEDIGRAFAGLDQTIAIGENALFAVAVLEVHEALRLSA